MITKENFWKSSIAIAFVVGLLASGGACKSNEEMCSDFECEASQQLYSCKPTTGVKQYNCSAGEIEANSWCQSIAGKRAVYIACDGYGDEIGDSEDTSDTGGPAAAWDPSSNVTYDVSSGHYLVNESFLEALKNDPGLILLDSTRVDESPTGYYALNSVTQGDLAAAMGLQSGDVLVSVNGYDLGSIDGLVDTSYALESATTFTLTILRNSTTAMLTYVVQ